MHNDNKQTIVRFVPSIQYGYGNEKYYGYWYTTAQGQPHLYTKYFGFVEVLNPAGKTLAYELYSFEINSSGSEGTATPAAEHAGAIAESVLNGMGLTLDSMTYDPDLGEESKPDGYGQNDIGTPAFDFHSETVDIPDKPAVSSTTVGFYNIYKVTTGTLNGLGEYLFPSIDWDTITDPTKALRAIAGMFAFRDSIQYIIDLHSIPVAPTIGASEGLRIGNLNAVDITAPRVVDDYIDFDCGTLSIPLNYQNALDFMVNASLFLPFIGFIDLKPELWNGGSINVKYRFNVVDGSFMCYVRASSGVSELANSVIGQYSGSACIHFPVIANSYGSIVGGLMQGAQALSKPATPLNAVGALESAATSFTVQPPMQSSNGYNASSSYLGGRKPYLMIEYPVSCMSSKYPHEHGFPLNVNMSFSGLTGYTEIDENVDLSGINAPVDVLDEIRKALASGTIF